MQAPGASEASGVSPLLASISSNDAKILALERRMTGHDASMAAAAWPSMGPGSLATAPTLSHAAPDAAAGARATQRASDSGVATGYGGISQRQPLASLAVGAQLPALGAAAAASGPAGPGAHPDAKRRRTGAGAAAASSPPDAGASVAAAAAAAATAAVAAASASAASAAAAAAAGSGRMPLGDITPPALERQASGVLLTSTDASVAAARAAAAAAAVTATTATPAAAAAAPGGAAAAAATGGRGTGGRSRKRKQQEPRHDPKNAPTGAAAAAPNANAAATATAAAAAAVAAAAAAPTPATAAAGKTPPLSALVLGTAATVAAAATAAATAAGATGQQPAGGGGSGTPPHDPPQLGLQQQQQQQQQQQPLQPLPQPHSTPRGVATRHLLFDDGAAAAGAGRTSSVGGRANSGRGGGGGAPASASAQKGARSILSYFPAVVGAAGGGGGAGAGGGGAGGGVGAAGSGGVGLAGAVANLFPDQSSRDGLPPPLHQHQQQQQHQGASARAAAAAQSGPGEESSAVAAAALQQQVSQLQAQVMQVQSALAAQQAAAGAEIERLRREQEARSAEVAALQERCRAAEAAAAQSAAAEAAARSTLEALQASSSADSSRWAAEAAEAARVAAEREARYRAELARLVQSSARLEREGCRAALSANAARLGTLSLVRTGPMQLAETWEDGTAFQQLAARRAALAAAREEVTAAQKALRKRLAPPPSGARSAAAAAATAAAAAAGAAEDSHLHSLGGFEHTNSRTLGAGTGTNTNAGYLIGHEFVAADEVFKTRLALLKREEEALREEAERLERDKLKQIRCLKLSREEDASRFGRWPVLPDRPGPEGRPRYVLMNLLGKGGFSEVFKAYDLAEARHVCVKIHALTPGWSAVKKESYVRHAIREYDIHRSLRHPAVVALLDVLEIDADTFATVLECCEGGDLDALMREHKTLPEREARCLMAQIFSGLRYLASRRVIHYDLKPANILFDGLGQAKITDFGLSKTVGEGCTQAGIELTSQGAGTYWYLPPEAFETGGPAPPRISNKLDVWSAGVIFFSLLYGRKPYGESMSQEQMLRERVMAQQRQPDFPARPAVSAEAKDFIRRCLAWHQDQRPDVEAAATDPYLTGVQPTPQQQQQAAAAAAAAAAGGGTNGSSSGNSSGAAMSIGAMLARR